MEAGEKLRGYCSCLGEDDGGTDGRCGRDGEKRVDLGHILVGRKH